MTEAKLSQKLRRDKLLFSYRVCFTNHTFRRGRSVSCVAGLGGQTFFHPCPPTLPRDKTEHHKVSVVVNKIHAMKRVECDAVDPDTLQCCGRDVERRNVRQASS